jgi:predicted nucleotidyltransferase component of viral defense system
VFGGGAALAAIHLHHRFSEDVDFFVSREVKSADLRPLARVLGRGGVEVQERAAGPVRSLVMLRGGQAFGKVDVAYYPYDPIEARTTWRDLRVESLLDMTVNKLEALLTRFQARDFVDMYFLLREGPERDLGRLLSLRRAKFEVGADRLTLAERFLMARDVTELPRMLRPLDLGEMIAFFEERARALVRQG